ncbi:hypothetical protein PMAYCL1PPCAC_15971, partial [Pristionchus mayeri]
CECCYISTFIYGVGALTIASKVIPFILSKLKGEKPIELQQKDFKKDVVYFFQFPGSPTASSSSPFCIKIESFLRLHNIKFERHNTLSGRGRNGKVPFIELNGEQHADSQIIIRRLTQIFNLKTYPDEQTAALGHAVDRLLDNHTFNLFSMSKHKAAPKVIEFIAGVNNVPALFVPILSKLGGAWLAKTTMERATTSIGTFPEHEYNELLRNDLVQLQTILGKKKFMLGEEPTTVDCTALGQFGFAYFAIPAARFCLHDLLESSEFAPLREYLERVKTRIF